MDIDAIKKAISYMETYPERRYTIPELAQIVGTSTTRFVLLFKEYTGTTVFAHLLTIRMKKAIRDLEQGRKPVSRIANEVSYRNVSSFIRAFKKYTGVTPQEWRNNYKS